MSKETKPKRTRSTKKVSEGESSHTAELEAKIAELEEKLSSLSSQVRPSETKPAPRPAASGSTHGTLPAGTKSTPPPAPKPEPARQRPAASGPTHGTLPAGMKPTPPPAPKAEARASTSVPEVGEVAPAYAQVSSSGYTGNKYFATRPRLSYHPQSKQFRGGQASATTTMTAPPPPPAPEPQRQQRGTLPAGTEQEKKSMWKAKGSEYENYVPEEETHKAPPPPPAEVKAQRGTLPAGFKPAPAPKAEAPKPAPQPEPARPRPAASGPTHGTLPAGMKPTPPPAPKEQHASTTVPEVGEVAPAYAQVSSSGYTGNKYFATRPRLSYHPQSKQFRGHAGSEGIPAPAPEPPKPKSTFRTTLPAGFKN